MDVANKILVEQEAAKKDYLKRVKAASAMKNYQKT